MTIPVFEQEIAAGLSDAVRAGCAVAYAAPVTVEDSPARISDRALARVKDLKPEWAKGSAGDWDLHQLNTILATVGWNKNDDVFDGLEMWVARHTPAHKPFNYEHDC